MNKELSFPADFKAEGEKGSFEGFVSVYGNIDKHNDVIVPGAFKKIRLTKQKKLRVLLYHDMHQPVGSAEVEDQEKGLFLRGNLNMDLKDAPQAYALLKEGMIDEMSVGFSIMKGGIEAGEQNGKDVTFIKAAELYEGSLVPFAANPQAKITQIKSEIETVRDFERVLRNLGYSQKQAKLIASHGFEGIHRDDEIPASEMLAKLDEMSSILHV